MMSAASAALALAMAASEPQGDPLARSAVPEDGRIVMRDYGYRDWGPELVRYAVDAKRFPTGGLVLLDAAGKAVPFQIDGGVLAFVASVPKGGDATWTLKPSPTDRSAENTRLRFAQAGGRLEVRNEHIALRLPAPGAKAFDPPVGAGGATPPVYQWAGADGAWMGRARLVTPRNVASQSFSLVRSGPACVEYEARYRFAPAGEYVWRVRLSPGMPIAVVTEEFDFGEARDGEDLLLLDLHAGWRPGSVGWVGAEGEQMLPPLHSSPLADYLAAKRSAREQAPPVGGEGQAPSPRVPEAGMSLLERIVPAGKWGGYKGGVQLWDGPVDKPGAGRTIGLVPLSAGSWRRTMALNAWGGDAGITVSLPISVRPMRWSLDIADDFSPFSTHEHDEGLSRTYGRRCWGLYVGPEPARAQARFGYIGLDRYKDWVVEWGESKGLSASAGRSEGSQGERYPGGFFSPAHVERIRKVLDEHPDGEFLKTWYVFSGRTEDAVRHARLVIEKLKKPYRENDFFLVGLSGYRKSQFLTFVHRAEDALACDRLPAELRRELLLRLSLYAHVMSEPDLNPPARACTWATTT